MIPTGSISNLRHSLANRLIPCKVLLEDVGNTTAFSPESTPYIKDGVALIEEMVRLISDFAETGADAAVPMRQTERTLHRLGGCIAPARAHFELARADQDENVQDLLDEIDLRLASVGTIVTDFRAEWFTGSKPSLRDVVARAVAATGDASHVEVELSDHSVFDDLTGNRFIREFLDEALINARKHGGAEVKLIGEFIDDEAMIKISDAGPGFDPDAVKHGHGMRVLQNSAVALGGSLAIRSNPSSVTLRFPIE